MYSAQLFQMEKQANRRANPMSPAEMVRFYSKPKKNTPGWLQNTANFLTALGQKVTAYGQTKAAPPAFQSK